MRYLAVMVMAGVSGLLGGCEPNVCKTTDAYWTNCVGQNLFNNGTYVGSWKDNAPNGEGSWTGPSGEYVGGYKDGKWHGQGTYTGADGSKYVGGHKDGPRHGQGTYTGADGSKYVGGHKDGPRHGQGTYTWADGSKYVGDWKDGMPNGQGTITVADGRRFEGYLQYDKSLKSAYFKGTEYGPSGAIQRDGYLCDGGVFSSKPCN